MTLEDLIAERFGTTRVVATAMVSSFREFDPSLYAALVLEASENVPAAALTLNVSLWLEAARIEERRVGPEITFTDEDKLFIRAGSAGALPDPTDNGTEPESRRRLTDLLTKAGATTERASEGARSALFALQLALADLVVAKGEESEAHVRQSVANALNALEGLSAALGSADEPNRMVSSLLRAQTLVQQRQFRQHSVAELPQVILDAKRSGAASADVQTICRNLVQLHQLLELVMSAYPKRMGSPKTKEVEAGVLIDLANIYFAAAGRVPEIRWGRGASGANGAFVEFVKAAAEEVGCNGMFSEADFKKLWAEIRAVGSNSED